MKRLAQRIADLQARLLLALFYYTLLAPFALAMRFAGQPRQRGWQRRPEPDGEPLEQSGRQY
jgi:hypothetical protein